MDWFLYDRNLRHERVNMSTVKLSYTYMKDMAPMISSRNRQGLRPAVNIYDCRRRDRKNFLLDNKCKTPQLYIGRMCQII